MLKSDKPFHFKTQLSLVLLTGMKARNLRELRDCLEQATETSVYHHTHHFLQQHQFLAPEPPNDFAYWTTTVLLEEKLGERLAAIDTVRFDNLESLRRAILQAIDGFLRENPTPRECPPGEEFHFMRSILFELPTPYTANDLSEFVECLRKVSIHSLYYHVFTGRLRHPVGVNDFSDWFESNGYPELARQMEKLDPYTQTMEGLRHRIISLIERRLKEEAHVTA